MNPCHYDRLFGFHYWDDSWPFDYPHWSEKCMPYEPALKEWQERADQAARRYNRQAKKKYPGYFEHIAEGVVIPGAWVEDKF